MQSILTLIVGILFGLGLIISGMANPLKVQNFLDLFGSWDPSLAFVMVGAIAVTSLGYWIILRRPSPVFEGTFHLPKAKNLDPKLITGAAIFGVGWGLSGFCPGPAITSISLFNTGTLIFVPAMLLGMWAAKQIGQRQLATQPAE